MFKHILLTVDLSDEGSWVKALPVALEYARVFDSVLHVMTVVPDFGTSFVGSFFPDDYEKDVMEKTREALHVFVGKHVPDGITVQHIIGLGTIYEEILRVGKDIKCDLIVMGSHRPSMQDYLLGPNAARVVRHADCSVLVVRP